MKKGIIFPLVFALSLVSYTTYAALDTFVVERVEGNVTFDDDFFNKGSSSVSSSSSISMANTSSGSSINTTSNNVSSIRPSFTSEPIITDDSYVNEFVNIHIYEEIIEVKNKEGVMVDTKVYFADVYLESLASLKTALAKDRYGTNIKEKTSVIAKRNNAVFAVNGDFYGAQEKGYVVRNGTVFRDRAKSESNDDGDLVIYRDGSYETFYERDVPLSKIVEKGAYQVFSFGPTLVKDGVRVIDEDKEVAIFSTKGNQRCAIGIIDPLHYVFALCDARTRDSWGMDLYQMGDYLLSKGVKMGYNLDGGGSATFYFNGRVLNNPTTDGKIFGEREVSDIVYFKK